ncbi:hypothetical protein [Halobacterium bonnevillei]|uniref:Uncharacterized protein n=1 Tax=Halobacterium bonnevillei TaxID=2692200 RepID=A0A6B0SRW7_9EURY|nr:hypothetical protein [Halobacterium bonnevillei]MXR21530.1 hypothetical protein [Halobacterium bonnevillei]
MRPLTRRSLLVTGTGAMAALAGCTGDGGGPSEETETTTAPTTTTAAQPTALDIQNPVLCAEAPAGYQQYTEQPEDTYEPGDVIWVYFEPSTVGTESAGEGEIRFEYDFSVSVTDPDGENLGTVEDTASRTIPEGSDLSTVFLSVNYSPPTEFEAGTHTLELEVTDTVAGNTATESIEFEVESGLEYTTGDFGFGEFAFTESEARGYRDYDERSPPEYEPTETVWYYYEIQGFAYEETSNALTTDLSIFETLTGPEGDIWSQADIPLSNMFDPETDLDTYYVADRVIPSDEWLPGEYELHFEVTDGHTDETVTGTYTFTVVE